MASWIARLGAALKAFRVGSAEVSRHEEAWGRERETFTPTKYGDYLATSASVYACANLRARNLAGLPLRLYKTDARGERTEVTAGRMFDLLRRVNPFWTFNRLIQMTELSLCLWGEGCWVLERGATGRGVPTEIWWVRADRMRPVPHPTGYLAGWIYENNGERLSFTPDEVIWFRYPNPIDEYSGLAPLASVRLSIETGHAALRSNHKIFEQGTQLAGVVSPADKDTSWSKDQVEALRVMLDKRFRGVDKAHRLAVLGQAASFSPMSISPKDAQFIELMRWTKGDVAMVYLTPPELIGDHEHATYSNIDQAYKGFWTDCLVPEAAMLAGEITEQLAPMFGGEVTEAEFDLSGVAALREDANAAAERALKFWTMGVPLNRVLQVHAPELLPPKGDGYAWGDEPGGQVEAGAPALPPGEPPPATAAEAASRALKALRGLRRKAIALGSPEHGAVYKRFDRRASRHEARVKATVVGLLERQRDELIAGLRAEKSLVVKDDGEIWDEEFWNVEFAAGITPDLRAAAQDAGDATLDELDVAIAFDVSEPRVARFLAARAQRFAQEVNATTWEAVKAALNEGREAGEGVDQLASRITETMGARIRSSAETIARTETIGALNGGALAAAVASEVVEGKGWLAAIDGRERETHAAAHERYQAEPIPLDADFQVGGASGPAPGSLGDPGEDINCRCAMTWVVKGDEGEARAIRSEVLAGIAAWSRRDET